MPAVTASITVRLPERLLERVDEAAASGGVSQNAWLVATLYSCLESGAAEQALGHSGLASGSGSAAARRPDPTPAEQPVSEGVMEFDDRGRMSRFEGTYAPREFRPYPKGGKR